MLMDVQGTGCKGLDGVASVCGNLVLFWAKVSLSGIGVESVIMPFGNNIYLNTSVNLAGNVYHVCIMGVLFWPNPRTIRPCSQHSYRSYRWVSWHLKFLRWLVSIPLLTPWDNIAL